MTVAYALYAVAALLALAPVAIACGRSQRGSTIVYGASVIATLILCTFALLHLLGPANHGASLVLPLGLPWLGAHFRIDALAAFFLIVVN